MGEEVMDDWESHARIEDQGIGYFFRGIRTIWSLCESEKKTFLWALTALLISEGFTIVAPVLFKLLIDELAHVQAEGVGRGALALVVLIALVRVIGVAVKRFAQVPLFLRAIIRIENLLPKLAQAKYMSLHLRPRRIMWIAI